MAGNPQPLDQKFPIVNPNGTPTEYFIRWAQQQLGLATLVPESRKINTTAPITGGGDLSEDRTIGHAASGVTPGPYTNANITVDDEGHVTAAADGSSGGVTVTGTPVANNLTQFSGPTSITDGDLSGDVHTNGTLVTTVVSFGAGAAALIAKGTNNIGIGTSLAALTTGANNIAVGSSAGAALTTGNNNTFYGFIAGAAITSGAKNVAVGGGTLAAETTGSNNVAVGYEAGFSQNGASNNMLLGKGTGFALTTGGNNVAVGANALLAETTGTQNVAVGTSAGIAQNGASNNVLFGFQSGRDLTAGSSNIFIGTNAGRSITTGSNNVVIGPVTGLAAGLTGNIILGDGSGAIKGQFDGSHWVLAGTIPATANTGSKFLCDDDTWKSVSSAGGAAEPTIVQSAVLCTSSGAGSITLGAAPTAGNLLVALGTRWAGTINTAAGWTLLVNATGPSEDLGTVFYKVAAAGETAAQQFSSTVTGWAMALYEIAGAAPQNIYVALAAGTITASVVTPNAGVVKSTCLGLGVFMAQARTNPTLTITGATVDSSGSDTNTTNGGPRIMKSCHQTALAKGAWQPSCTYGSSGFDGYATVIIGGVA